MKHKLFFITCIFIGLICVTGVVFEFMNRTEDVDEVRGEQAVAFNEVKQLIHSGDQEQAEQKVNQLENNIKTNTDERQESVMIPLFCCMCILFLLFVSGYFYVAILRPFEKMKQFTKEIAKGDLDIPLEFERSNYFGEFTWAFDSMRKEIIKARACEQEAVANNKTVIATLSHDIKTPIASIRAYAEGLEANLANSTEKKQKYIDVMLRKCDEVSKLTNDLFLHSLSDMGRLQISSEKFELGEYLHQIVSEIAASRGDVSYYQEVSEAYVCADQKRIEQIVENIINNARKYAKTKIDINMKLVDDRIEIHFRDYGKGIPDEDMPFIFGKFYRGSNIGEEQGSGLGLYIVQYLARQMNGDVQLCNHKDGLEVILSLPYEKN